MADAPPVPIARQIACVTRELGFRRRVYARRLIQSTRRGEVAASPALFG